MEQYLLSDSVEEGLIVRSRSRDQSFEGEGEIEQDAAESVDSIEPLPAEPVEPNSGDQAVVDQVANYFRVLGEPMRLKLLNVLREGERCVQDLVEETETSQANVSKHLKVMLQAGILAKRSQGTQAFYRVTDDLIFELCNLVCDRLATRIEQQALHFRTFSLASKPGSEEGSGS
jgi:DNA-binding transcriptional ArsR family regulator